MLSVAFQLTPAQVKVLLATAFDHRSDTGLPMADVKDFVTPGSTLIRKGLLFHSNDQHPTWVATDLGKALARAIVKDCHTVIQMADGADGRAKQWVPKAVKKQVRLK